MALRRYVALGDSFTEGVGDPDPARPNGLRGWADRVAEVLSTLVPDPADGFGYANLAIRGRKLPQIIDEQVGPAIELGPDLVTIHGGGNDVLRPKVNLDALASQYDDAIGRLRATGATVALFTIADPGATSMRIIRGRTAIFNEWVREIAEKHDAVLVDLWRLRGWKPHEVMDADRLHLNPTGHQHIALEVLAALGVSHEVLREVPEARPAPTRREDLMWAREHLAPWVHRRLTGRSSGDGISPKRPTFGPV
jgi:lysophospholipase L1-like esterase